MKISRFALMSLILHFIFSYHLILSGNNLQAASSAEGLAAPTAKMTKIIFRNITPGVDKDSYEAQPVTVYLYGDHYIRVEEQPDTLQGLHGLMIVRNSESWSINLMDNTANHYVADSDLYNMNIPLIPQTVNDERFEGLDYGRELTFFSSATISQDMINDISVQHYDMIKDGIRFELLCKKDPVKPYILRISAGGQPMYQYMFEQYMDDLPVDMTLFEIPANVKVRRLPPHPSDRSQKDSMIDDNLKKNLEFPTFYYQNPQPRKAGQVLKNILNSSFFNESYPDNAHSLDTMAYFYSRIARSEPSVVDDYLALFKIGSYEQRCYVLKILQVCGNQRVIDYFKDGLEQNSFGKEKERIEYAIQKGIPIQFDPLTRPIKEAGDLDFLWMEFMATGKEEAVIKVIETLKDCNSDNQDKYILANTALWSLKSFCREHEKVMDICKKYIQKSDGIISEKLEELISESDTENLPRQLSDKKMLKAVLREMTSDKSPKLSEDKTYYRLGSKLWHVEKQSSSGSPMTIIVKEPNIWILMTRQKEGIHFTGPEEYNYHFPMALPADSEVNLRGLQLGTELAFMKAKKARYKPAGDENTCSQYILDLKQVHVELLCKPHASKEIPYKLTIIENGTKLFECIYDEYNYDLPPDKKLFDIPKDIKISEESWN